MIQNISHFDQRVWQIDVDNYTEDNTQLIIDCKEMIKDSFGEYTPTKVLISKIMLGIFGNVPAFDENFTKKMKYILLIRNY